MYNYNQLAPIYENGSKGDKVDWMQLQETTTVNSQIESALEKCPHCKIRNFNRTLTRIVS